MPPGAPESVGARLVAARGPVAADIAERSSPPLAGPTGLGVRVQGAPARLSGAIAAGEDEFAEACRACSACSTPACSSGGMKACVGQRLAGSRSQKDCIGSLAKMLS